MDEDLKYLLIIFLVLAGTATAHNLYIDEDDALSIGMCDTDLHCGGFEVNDFCVGVNYRTTECYGPGDAEEYRMAEAKCATQAYNLCEDNDLEQTEWADEASYENKTCEDWNEDYEEFTLITCDDMSPSTLNWENISR